jgi:hypothetical protein
VLQSLEAEAIFPYAYYLHKFSKSNILNCGLFFRLFYCDIRVDGAIMIAVALKDIQENVNLFLVLTTSEVDTSEELR